MLCGKGWYGVHEVDGYAALVAGVLDVWVADVKLDPRRQNGRKRRQEAEEIRRRALADLRHLRRHPQEWGVLAFLCEHTDLPPSEVMRGLWLRAGLPWQTEMRLEEDRAGQRWAA
jgi:hypothetical protein